MDPIFTSAMNVFGPACFHFSWQNKLKTTEQTTVTFCITSSTATYLNTVHPMIVYHCVSSNADPDQDADKEVLLQ